MIKLKYKKYILIEAIVFALSLCIMLILITIGQILLSYIFLSLIMVSLFLTVMTMSLGMFKKDKMLDIEALTKQGLTVITCKECNKTNVLEDIFCIFCGEKLGEEHE